MLSSLENILQVFYYSMKNCQIALSQVPLQTCQSASCVLCLKSRYLALSCIPITSKSGIKSRRDVTSLLLWSYRHNIPPALNQWVYPPPPMLWDACMFRFMIIFALCFMMGTGHRQGTIQKCQGWIWLPPGLMPLHFGNAPSSLRLYHTITLANFNGGPGQDLDFNWNHRTNLQKYL